MTHRIENKQKHHEFPEVQHKEEKYRLVLLFAVCSFLFNIFVLISWTTTSKEGIQVAPLSDTAKGILTELHMNMIRAAYAKTIRKLDENGQYVPFTGNTIICKFTREEIARWAVVAKRISENPLLRKYFAPLPPSSYHMTVFELFHEGPMNRETYWYLLNSMSPLFRSIQYYLDDDPVQPLQARVDKVFVRRIISVLIKHTPEEEKKLRDFREWCGEKTLLGSSPDYAFHISLAYMYRTPETQEERHAIREEVSKLLPQSLMDEPIRLMPAHVVTYQTMLKYDDF